jgi:hypothetical protein
MRDWFLCRVYRAKLEAADVPVGPRQDEFMNTVVGGPADAPALVMIPGELVTQ